MATSIVAAVLVAVLVGGFFGVILTFAVVRFLHQRQGHELAELPYFRGSNDQAKSPVSWKSINSRSTASPTSPKPKKQISEPILLKNFEGKAISLPSHMSEMLGVHSKRACQSSSPLSSSPKTSFRESSRPGLAEASGSQSQNDAGVPMLLRQPRKKSASALPRERGSVCSTASAESAYSTASASSYMHHILSSTASANGITGPGLARNAESVELFSMYETESRGSYYWTLDPSTITRVSTMAGAFNDASTPIIENLYLSPPGLPVERPTSIESFRTASVDRSRTPSPSPPPLPSKSVPYLR